MLSYVIDEEFFVSADSVGREKMKKRIYDKHGYDDERVIARSILSKPIEAHIVGEGKNTVAIFAAHHALESITSNLAYLMIDLLLSGMKKQVVNTVDCKLLLSKYKFIIVPCVNPDGVEMRMNGYGTSPLKERQMRMSGGDLSTWQANARGVDLNHNYDSGFFEYAAFMQRSGIDAGPTLYGGEYPESEPETRGVANLIRVISPVAVLSLHSQGEEIYSYPDTPRTMRAAARLSGMTGYKVCQASGSAAYSGLCDYTGALGIPSFTYEVGRGRNPLPETMVGDIFYRIAESIVILPTLL